MSYPKIGVGICVTPCEFSGWFSCRWHARVDELDLKWWREPKTCSRRRVRWRNFPRNWNLHFRKTHIEVDKGGQLHVVGQLDLDKSGGICGIGTKNVNSFECLRTSYSDPMWSWWAKVLAKIVAYLVDKHSFMVLLQHSSLAQHFLSFLFSCYSDSQQVVAPELQLWAQTVPDSTRLKMRRAGTLGTQVMPCGKTRVQRKVEESDG